MTTAAERSLIADQLQIPYGNDRNSSPHCGLPEAFRKLYFQLYTNSKASRADRIIEDLTLLLLLKLSVEVNGGSRILAKYREGSTSANQLLIPLLRKAYPALVDSRQTFSIGDEAINVALNELEEITLSTAPAHVLGEAFQALIGPRLRGDKGQFFTPRSLVRAMVEIVAPQPNQSVLDPACGTGGFLLEAHTYQSKIGNVQKRLVGIDKDHDLFRLCSAMLRIASRDRGEVFNFNSLDVKQWGSRVGEEHFDVILTNPPFGARIGLRDQTILEDFALGHQWIAGSEEGRWRQTKARLGTQDPQVLFLELCVRKLKVGGRLGIVLPEGTFGNKGDAYIWEWLGTQGKVYALLDCPRTTFQPGTDTKTNVLFFERGAETYRSLGAKNPVKIGVALQCGHDRRGRTHLSTGAGHPDDFQKLAEDYHQSREDGHWRSVELRVGGYMVPRYYVEEKPLTAQESDLTSSARFSTLGDLVTVGILAIRKGHEVGSQAYGTGDVPFIRTSDLSNFEISVDPTKAIADSIYEEYSQQQKLKPGDLLMVVDGRYRIGTTAILTEANSRCVVQSHLRIISVLKPDFIDPYELLFALNLPSVKLRIRDLVFVQSTLGTLGSRLLELRVPIFHGQGPWRERVDRFKTTLQQRDKLLGDLRAMSGAAYEL
jgi:type I restriction enzyme M protein